MPAYVREVPHCDKVSSNYEFYVSGYDRKDGTHTPGPAEFLADKFADSLDKCDLLAFRDAYRARGAAEATVAKAERELKAALAWCYGEDFITENPWARYRAPKAEHESRQGTLEDFRKLYALLPAWAQWPCRTTMGPCCLRPGVSELFSLTWKIFDWNAGAAAVYMGKVGRTKTVYPPADYLAEARRRFEASGDGLDGLVCPGPDGGRIRYEAFRWAWNKAGKFAGVGMPPYAMRHIDASQMLAGGAELAAVAAQLGHRDLTTTGRFYVHALPDAQRRAAKALPGCTMLGAAGAASDEKR